MPKRRPTWLKIYVIPVLTVSMAIGSWDVIATKAVPGLWVYFGYIVIIAVSLYLYLAYLDRYLR